MFATTKSNIQQICKTIKRWKSSLMFGSLSVENECQTRIWNVLDLGQECMFLELHCCTLQKLIVSLSWTKPKMFFKKRLRRARTNRGSVFSLRKAKSRLILLTVAIKKDTEGQLSRNTQNAPSKTKPPPPCRKKAV